MSYTNVSDLLVTNNSFYGISYYEYIDSLKGDILTDKSNIYNEVRKSKVAESILPIILEIYNKTKEKKKRYTYYKKSITNLLSESKQYFVPTQNSIRNLLETEIKLSSIMSISNESVFDENLATFILRVQQPILNDNKYSEEIFNLSISHQLFKFNNLGKIVSTWCDKHIKHSEIQSDSDFYWKFDIKSSVYLSCSNNEIKFLYDSFELIRKTITELRHFSLYNISSSNFQEKCPNYYKLIENAQYIIDFYQKRENLIIQKFINKYPNEQKRKEKLIKNDDFNYFHIPKIFLEELILKENFRNQLTKIFEMRRNAKKYNNDLKSCLSYQIKSKYNNFSANIDIKTKQEEILNRVINNNTKAFLNIIWDLHKPLKETISFFKTIFSEKDSDKFLYGVSIEQIYNIINLPIFPQKTNDILNLSELKKFDIIFRENNQQNNLIDNIKTSLLSTNAPIIKNLCSLTTIIQIVDWTIKYDMFSSSEKINLIYEEITKKAKESNYIDNIYFFSLYDFLLKITKKVQYNSNDLLIEEIFNLSIDIPSKFNSFLEKKCYKENELEDIVIKYESCIDDLKIDLENQNKYISIFNKIILIVKEKLNKYTDRIIKLDVQKKLGTYSISKLNKDPQNIPTQKDWDWILNIIEIGEKEYFLPEGTTQNVLEFINNSKNNKKTISLIDKKYSITKTSIIDSKKTNINKLDTTSILEIKTPFELLKNGYKNFKEFNQKEQDIILKSLIDSSDMQNTKKLTSYGITSSDILGFIIRNK
jgi:hypothetical protein